MLYTAQQRTMGSTPLNCSCQSRDGNTVLLLLLLLLLPPQVLTVWA
jgi:hypothetical protein